MQRRSARCKRPEELNIGHDKNSEHSKIAEILTIATDTISIPQKEYLGPYIKTANMTESRENVCVAILLGSVKNKSGFLVF